MSGPSHPATVAPVTALVIVGELHVGYYCMGGGDSNGGGGSEGGGDSNGGGYVVVVMWLAAAVDVMQCGMV